MIVINTNTHNGTQKGVNIFYAAPILSGSHAGKFATSENALNEFPEIFENEPYEFVELDPSAFEIDYTPPPMSGNLVAIPPQFEWVFRNDKFEINGFVVDFIRTPDDILAVDIAYLQWEAFRLELDKPENATVKNSLEPIWGYVLEQINNGNFI
jgi:hypothetical protein